MSGSPTPTIADFAGELVSESRWYELGVFLGLPTYELDTISREYSREGVMRCLIEMYKRMEERGTLPSWGKISAALRTMNNNRLAQYITSRCIQSSQQDSSIEEVSTPETVIRSIPGIGHGSPVGNTSIQGSSLLKKTLQIYIYNCHLQCFCVFS